MYQYKATIVSIYDGDTFRADIDLGFYTHVKNISCRLAGINAPEMIKGTQPGIEARDFLRSLIPIGSVVTLDTFKDKQEKYGRWLAHITNDVGVDVNAEMVRTQHAVSYMVQS